ncbi:MAG: C4-type zinc ribbon domain-containing protein [Prevotellaceae bacterium]|jgi:predicted  nucleic acid-binding Zn-ribbon protein|nr:C4-type zinc ribbon domain-containing protein [Prevotellaceae bacterium]
MAKKTETKKSLFSVEDENKEGKIVLLQQILKTKPQATVNDPVERKLHLLYELQLIDSAIDEIKILRGELPNEVKALEDEIVGLETRVSNIDADIKKTESDITKKKLEIKNSEALISKYEEQQKNVRNNREFESLAKEIEYQGLEMELSRKKIREAEREIEEKKESKDNAILQLGDIKKNLTVKQQELEKIIANTQKEEQVLDAKAEEYKEVIEPRLLNAYQRLRKNARNGLAVVEVKRDACGGCFNKIPPQRQVDIKMGKRLIPCEYCGRILVDWGDSV